MSQAQTPGLLEQVDHLVYAVPDLARGIDTIESLTGVRPGPGGRHPGWGTANALLGLGPGRYLEVIGPDPEQAGFSGERLFHIDQLDGPRLVTWAAKGRGLERLAGINLGDGERIGQALPASRQREDGSELRWVLTDPTVPVASGLIPFFIDWGDSPHPFTSAPGGVELVDLSLEHPDPEGVRAKAEALSLGVTVKPGSSPAIVATLQTPLGELLLR